MKQILRVVDRRREECGGMAGLLIEARADLNARHSSGTTPIGIAQQKQEAEIIALVCR